VDHAKRRYSDLLDWLARGWIAGGEKEVHAHTYMQKITLYRVGKQL